MDQTLFELIDAILSSQPSDASSMQVYDAIALTSKLDKQVRLLAQYIASGMSMNLSFDVSESKTDVIELGGKTYCTVVIDRSQGINNITVTFAERMPMLAKAWFTSNGTNTILSCTVVGHVVTVTGLSAVNGPVTLQIV